MLSWWWWIFIALIVLSVATSIIRNRTQAYNRDIKLQQQSTDPKMGGQGTFDASPVYQTNTSQMQYQASEGQIPPIRSAQPTPSNIPNAALPPNAIYTPYHGTSVIPATEHFTVTTTNTYPPTVQNIAPPPSYVAAIAAEHPKQKVSYTSQQTHPTNHLQGSSSGSAHSPIDYGGSPRHMSESTC
ncbi:hypothetical protein SARC_06617 [Sphaeroforma arctica JP610]|uniref:Uncharacterized protein n=1 Tax=Sphaeroforma arctica JP610 TaxID=667725 RepID=A0A0L0FW20_9EUKA|nr:hypothetical protein SARC_06617 [Sphaeroforma arctica JP610]KNC81040.1 hypothetical protein SARC_06617 [Sphaeroforma arctica JP610]|eukprot:XP_014154942.1 hypothetical protein SARC_06617 [Sphaeroforma arctica JP610]